MHAESDCRVTSPGLGIARWCPHCLDTPEPQWQRGWTDGVAICMAHSCWLIDGCRECGSAASWRSLRLLQCRCGADLTQHRAVPWSDDLHVLLHAPVTPFEKCIGDASTDQRLALAEVLGALDRYGLQGKPLKRASARAASNQLAIVERGASIVVNADTEIGPLLQRLRTPNTSGQSAQLVGEAWPGLLRLLRRRLKGPSLDWIVRQLEQHTATPLAGVVIQPRRVKAGAPSGARGLALAAGVRVERVPALLSDCGLSVPARRSKSGRQMLAVSDAVVARVREHLQDLVSARAAQKRFGLSVARLEMLAEAGLLMRVGGRYNSSAIQELLQQLAATSVVAPPTKPTAQHHWCSLHRALQLHILQCQTPAFFSTLRTGALRIQCKPGSISHARDLQLLESEVMAWSRSVKPVCDELTIPQASATLGLKQEVTYHLVRVGLLETSDRLVGRRTCRVISQQEIDRFRSDVSPLSKLASLNGIDFRSALSWARERGLVFVSGPGIDGGRQFFVRCGQR